MRENTLRTGFIVVLLALLFTCLPVQGQGSLPSGWVDGDIGSVTAAGSASYSSGVFTVQGAGGSLNSTPDAQNFLYQEISGDGTIVARVVSSSSSYAQVGIAIRETLDADATKMAVVDYPYWGAIFGVYRLTTGASSSDVSGGTVTLPYWVKLVRSGSTFTGYMSADGVNWVTVTSQTISMASSVYIGMEVDSGDTTTTSTGTFDNVSVSTAAAPAPEISSVSATTGSVGSEVVISGANFGSSQGSSLVLLNGTSMTVDSWSATSITITIASGATSGYLVVSVGSSMNDSNPVYFTVTSNPLPAGWLDQDVGIVGVAGSATYSSGVFTIQGAGSALNSTPDALHFVYQEMSGDGTIVARVVSLSSSYGQVGIAIRETLDQNSTKIAVIDYPYYGAMYGVYRSTTSGSSSDTNAGAVTLPYWVKLVRSGSTFTGYMSDDGVNWVTVTSQTISMASSVYIGMGVDSGNTYGTYTGTFDNVSLSTAADPAPVISSVSATTGSVGSEVVISGANFGSSQGSSSVLLNATSMTVDSWSATSITITIASGATSGDLVVSVGSGMDDSNPVYFAVTSNPLPAGWLDQDVGIVGVAGSATYSGGVFTIQGAGSVFNSTPDALHFVYQALTGNGTIVARVVSTSSIYGQVGIAIRQTLDADSAGMAMTTYYGSIYNLYRSTTGGSSSDTNGGTVTLPYWVKLVRSGSTFTGYMSSDGVNWVIVGTSQTISMTGTIYIGMGVDSGNTYGTYTGTFDNVSLSTAADPAPVISSVSATTGSVGSEVVISGANFGSSQGSSSVLLNATSMTVDSWSATSITITIASGATSGDLVVSVGSGMDDSNPVYFAVTSNPLPAGWLDQDVGVVGIAGSATYSGGVFTIQGAGSVFNSTPDALHFVYQALTGDGTIVARVASTSNAYAQAEVLIRETLDADAKSVAAIDTSGSTYNTYRSLTGGSSSSATGGTGTLPYWLKVVRAGNSFTAYASPDGSGWNVVAGPLLVEMADTVYFGMGVNSNGNTASYTVTFDNVSISTSSTGAPDITGVSATSGSVGNSVVISGTGFGASQGSSVVQLNDVPVTITSWSATSITITIPTGATSGPLNVLVGSPMNSSNAVIFTVTTNPLPSGWLDQDIGAVGLAGNASYSSGVFTVQAAGSGVVGTADSFHFVYQPLTSDGTITAEVLSESAYAQAGVMLRETLDQSSADVFSYLVSYSGNTYANMGFRPIVAAAYGDSGGGTVTLPTLIEAVRQDNTFTCYAKEGGVWTQIGATQTLTMAETVYVGLGVSSGVTTTLATATFDDVSVTLGSSLPNPEVSSVSPISGAPGDTVTIDGSGFGTSQGTSGIYFNGATATVSSWSDSEIVAVVPESASTGTVSVTVGNITGTGPSFTIAFGVQLTDSLGNETTYSSSIAGGQWEFTDAEGSGCSSCTTRGTIHNQYDGSGNLLWTEDALGNNTIYGYDSSNNLTTQFVPIGPSSSATTTYTYNSFGEVLTMTDPLGHVTTNTYDSHGNLTSVTTPAPGGGASASETQFTYNSLGELTQITDALSHVTTMTYTSAGLIATITDPQSNVTTYAYDSRGNRTSITDALSHVTTFAYDSGNRLTTITYPGSLTSTFTYDSRGRRITATDQNGKTTTYAYDTADRLTSVTDPASNVTTYTYDTENNLLSIEDANSHTTSFTYDAYGRVTETTFPSSHYETYAYDANNNLTSKTDRKGQTINYVYDALNRLTEKDYPDSTSVEYTYDLVGKVTGVNDPTGTYGFSYDNMGRLTGTTTEYSFLSGTFTDAYTYDAASNRTGFTAPDSSTNTYSYDTLNRLTTLANSWAGSFGFSYDGLSRRTQMTRPNSITTNYSYDSLSRLLSVLHQAGGSTIDGDSYTVDSAGNRTVKVDRYAGVTSDYTYDPLYELTQVTQASTTTESYSYDAVGNRTASLGVSSYTTNSSNEMTANSNASYVYDYNGNTTSKTVSSATTDYTWDYENRLASVTLPSSGGTATFKYDPFGRRIQKVFTTGTTTTTTNYLYDGDNDVEEVDASGTILARYTQGENIDEPLAESRSSTTSFYEADGLGSVTSLTNGSGTIANSYTYDSFGNLTASSGSIINPFQYSGRDYDSETGLRYHRARYYDSVSGRFISSDPTEFLGGLNFYSYANNNPVDLFDPFGLNPNSGPTCDKKCPTSAPSLVPKTIGLVLTGTAAAGVGPWGGSVVTGSGGVASSNSSTVLIGTGGAATSAGNYVLGSPGNQSSAGFVESRAYGASVGGGVGVTWSNGEPCQLRGPFKTMNFDIGFGLQVSGSIAFGSNGTYQVTIGVPGLSYGFGAQVSSVNTNTGITGH